MICLHTPGTLAGLTGGRVVVFLTYGGGGPPINELSAAFHVANRNLKSRHVHLTRRVVARRLILVKDCSVPLDVVTVEFEAVLAVSNDTLLNRTVTLWFPPVLEETSASTSSDWFATCGVYRIVLTCARLLAFCLVFFVGRWRSRLVLSLSYEESSDNTLHIRNPFIINQFSTQCPKCKYLWHCVYYLPDKDLIHFTNGWCVQRHILLLNC